MKFLRDNLPFIILALITFFGLLIRLYQLTWQCLAVDEVVTQTMAAHTTIDIIRWSFGVDCNPPTYYLLAHWSSVMLRGVTWFSIRIPAVIFGTLGIPMIYLVGKEVKSWTLGLLAASLLSFMFPFVFYSQDARGYMLVMFAFLGFTLFFIKMICGDRRTFNVVALGMFAALSLWSHYYSAIPLAIAFILLFYHDKISAVYSGCVAGILIAPMALFLNFSNILSRAAPDAIPGYLMLTPDHQWWNTPLQMASMLPNELLCWSWIVLLPLAAYAVWRCHDRVINYFILIATGSCIALCLFCFTSNLSPRYALLVAPLLVIAGMYPIAGLIDVQKSIARKTVIFVLVIFIIAVFNYGSLLSWFTFNVCPLVNAVDAGIKVIGK